MTAAATVDQLIGDPRAEVALLGAVLIAAEAGCARAAAVLGDARPDDFTDPRHELVATAVRALLDRGVPPDAVVLLAELRRTGAASWFVADRAAGVFVADLVAACPAVAMAEHYRAQLVEATTRRRAVQAAGRVKQAAEGAGNLADLCALVDREMAAVRAAVRRVRT